MEGNRRSSFVGPGNCYFVFVIHIGNRSSRRQSIFSDRVYLNRRRQMNDRGSYTIELSIVISIILVVIAMVLFRFGRAFELVITDRHDPTIYQEAFLEKIEELRLEKIMKEKR